MGGTGEQTKEETSPTESGTVANTKPPGAEPWKTRSRRGERQGRGEGVERRGGRGMGRGIPTLTLLACSDFVGGWYPYLRGPAAL